MEQRHPYLESTANVFPSSAKSPQPFSLFTTSVTVPALPKYPGCSTRKSTHSVGAHGELQLPQQLTGWVASSLLNSPRRALTISIGASFSVGDLAITSLHEQDAYQR